MQRLNTESNKLDNINSFVDTLVFQIIITIIIFCKYAAFFKRILITVSTFECSKKRLFSITKLIMNRLRMFIQFYTFIRLIKKIESRWKIIFLIKYYLRGNIL